MFPDLDHLTIRIPEADYIHRRISNGLLISIDSIVNFQLTSQLPREPNHQPPEPRDRHAYWRVFGQTVRNTKGAGASLLTVHLS